MKQKAYAVFVVDNDTIWLEYGTLPDRTFRHLAENPIQINGDTHLAKFCRSRADREDGTLHNTMPGSTFTKYAFEKHTFGVGVNAVTVIVGWYW